MVNSANPHSPASLANALVQRNFLFKGLDLDWLESRLDPTEVVSEKLYSNRPIYTAFRPEDELSHLYVIDGGGPVIVRSTPLDRVLAIAYPGGCFGMRSLPVAFGRACRAFPSQVEAYKTTDVIKVPVAAIQTLYTESEVFRDRYDLLFELQEKFQYHLLNCSTYPPQAVAALLRALVYQERALGSQPQPDGSYGFDLPVDLIARACQLNHRTVEQVLKGMVRCHLLRAPKGAEAADTVTLIDPEGLKAVYGATRDKVAWWPLK
ncbi:cAMP-binding protein [filamentous cyanobacterium CCP5]|nr:cAMP-binding protein [filamentous cyanobacterium CCP5]